MAETPAPAPADIPAPAPWTTGMDAADIGWLENRGWKDLEPGKAAQEAIKAYRSAESRLGIPADQVVRWPKDATDAENWATVRERLGVPKEASEYDFSSVKKPDGGDLDAAFQDWARATASGLALPKDVAPKLAAEVVKFNATKAAEDAAAAQAAQVEQEAKLRADWSTNYDANLFVAKGAAQALGIGPEVVDALARAGVGYADTLEMFRKIGAQIGEDKFVRPLNPNASGVKTRDGAVAELAELKTDEAAVKRYLSGDQAEVRKWNALHVIIAGDDVEESRRRAMR